MHPHSPHIARNGSVVLSAMKTWKLPNINRFHDVTMSQTAVRSSCEFTTCGQKKSDSAGFTFLSLLKEKEKNTKNSVSSRWLWLYVCFSELIN